LISNREKLCSKVNTLKERFILRNKFDPEKARKNQKEESQGSKMNIKNYTSSVPIGNSISKIEHRLAQAGATHISKSYEEGKPIGMMFQKPGRLIQKQLKL
jgi:hypothetical protein